VVIGHSFLRMLEKCLREGMVNTLPFRPPLPPARRFAPCMWRFRYLNVFLVNGDDAAVVVVTGASVAFSAAPATGEDPSDYRGASFYSGDPELDDIW